MENQKRGIVPRKIKGFRDIDPAVNQLKWSIIERASSVYKKYGFEHWDTPILEYADSIGKFMPAEDNAAEGQVATGVYSFRNLEKEPVLDESGNELLDKTDFDKVVYENQFVAMRYDHTAPLARLYAEQLWQDKLKGLLKSEKSPLFRRYQFGPVFRYELKVDSGRYREFWQLDFDTVGTNDLTADAEVCMIAAEALEAIGLKRGTYKVKVNDRKILKGFLQNLGVHDETTEQNILRVIDKLDKIGLAGLKEELAQGRTDASGSKIAGLNLPKPLIKGIIDFFKKFEKPKSRKKILELLSKLTSGNAIFNEGVDELKKIDTVLTSMGFNEKRVVFDPTLVRGMSYYTGPVFEVESNQTFNDDKGNYRKVGAICGGGRYDDLVEKLLGIKVPATGFSIGVDRLAELLQLTNQVSKKVIGPVFIVVFDNNLMPEYQKIAVQLRKAKIDTEVYYGFERGLKKQLAYADKKNCPVAIMMGEDELKKGVITIKDLIAGKEVAASFTDKAEWLKTIQFEVQKDELVRKIQAIIKKYR